MLNTFSYYITFTPIFLNNLISTNIYWSEQSVTGLWARGLVLIVKYFERESRNDVNYREGYALPYTQRDTVHKTFVKGNIDMYT
jgi:hypothetical protein